MFGNKKLIAVGISSLLLAACSDDDPIKIADVSFADKEIKACIDKLVEDNQYEYTYEISSLNCPGTQESPITKLDGLETFTSLASLVLTHNDVTSLTPLTDLNELKSVNLAKNLALDCKQATDQLAVSRFSKLSLTGFCQTSIAAVNDDFSDELKFKLGGNLELAKQEDNQIILQSLFDSAGSNKLEQGALTWPLEKANDGIGFIVDVKSKIGALHALDKPILSTEFAQLTSGTTAQLNFIFDKSLVAEQTPELEVDYQYIYHASKHQFNGHINVMGTRYAFSLYKTAINEEKQIEHLDIDLSFTTETIDAALPSFNWRVSGPGTQDTLLNQGQVNINTMNVSYAQLYDMSKLSAQ